MTDLPAIADGIAQGTTIAKENRHIATIFLERALAACDVDAANLAQDVIEYSDIASQKFDEVRNAIYAYDAEVAWGVAMELLRKSDTNLVILSVLRDGKYIQPRHL